MSAKRPASPAVHTPPKRARQKNSQGKCPQVCSGCTVEQNLFRTGPDGRCSLCNRCGYLYFRRKLPLYRDLSGSISASYSPGASLVVEYVIRDKKEWESGYIPYLYPVILRVSPQPLLPPPIHVMPLQRDPCTAGTNNAYSSNRTASGAGPGCHGNFPATSQALNAATMTHVPPAANPGMERVVPIRVNSSAQHVIRPIATAVKTEAEVTLVHETQVPPLRPAARLAPVGTYPRVTGARGSGKVGTDHTIASIEDSESDGCVDVAGLDRDTRKDGRKVSDEANAFSIKARLKSSSGEHVVHRFTIVPGISFKELASEIRRMFGLRTQFMLSYEDEEKDNVRVSSSNELAEMLAVASKFCISPIRITVILLKGA